MRIGGYMEKESGYSYPCMSSPIVAFMTPSMRYLHMSSTHLWLDTESFIFCDGRLIGLYEVPFHREQRYCLH